MMIQKPVQKFFCRNEHRSLRIAAFLLAAGLLIAAAAYFDVRQLLGSALEFIRSLGSAGPAAFILIYTAATVLFIPGSVLTLGAGAIFGVVWGSVYVSLASTLGAALAFLIGRHFTRAMVEHRISGHPKFSAVDRAVGQEGWTVVFLTRLSPIFPFNLLNYAFGLTSVSFTSYIIASWLGMMPGTVMYVYLGSLAGEIAELAAGSGERQRSAWEWALYSVGLLATIWVTVVVTKAAGRALEEKTDNEQLV